MSKYTSPLEPATRKKIDQILTNLGWKTDEVADTNCNVFTERAKTKEQEKLLKKISGYKKPPDYVLYESGTDTPIAIIEAKRLGQSLDAALNQAIKKYANPLGVNLVFVSDGALVQSWDIRSKSPLYIDGQLITDFISESLLLRFVKEKAKIFTSPTFSHTKAEMIDIFKDANNLLRKDGIRAGIDRFTEFSNLLFLKLISEMQDEREKNGEARILEKKYCWESFQGKKPKAMHQYITKTILPKLVSQYSNDKTIFQKLSIKNPITLKDIVDKLSTLNLLNTDTDVKGDAFEYFLKNAVQVAGTDLGEYFTPRHIVKLIVELLDPKFGNKVYDPCCGTGGFLIESFRHIKTKCKHTKSNLKELKENTVFGNELTSTARIAKNEYDYCWRWSY